MSLRKFFYWKIAWDRAGTYMNVPLDLIGKVSLLLVVLKLYNLDNFVFITLAVLAYIIGRTVVGYFDIRWKLVHQETAIKHELDPVFNQVKKGVEKLLHEKDNKKNTK